MAVSQLSNFLFITSCLVLFHAFFISQAWAGKTHHYEFELTRTRYTRLCSSKDILTINGEFPGPTIYAEKGDTLVVDVYNKADENITLHWHGIEQPRNPWADGPSYITQCPIKPAASFRYVLVLSNEVGTLWWHAHSDWSRATVYGAIVVYPTPGYVYPFRKAYAEIPILLGSWWKRDVAEILNESLRNETVPALADSNTINGQPGDFLPCSKEGTFRMVVKPNQTYLLRVVNAAMEVDSFFAVANHTLTVVGRDGAYIKPINTSYIMITPGQTMDVLMKADQPIGEYYMAFHAYSSNTVIDFDNSTATAILQYGNTTTGSSSTPSFPTSLPDFNDTAAANRFVVRLRSKSDRNRPIDVPQTVDTNFKLAIAINFLPCVNNSCATKIASSINNISFATPSIDILGAYYQMIKGVYETNAPSTPPYPFNYTSDTLPSTLLLPERGTRVHVIEYNSNVEIVIQGTNLVAAENHPIHLHGYSFYVVGLGLGNFDEKNSPSTYNLVDPPLVNTVGVPRSGWVAIRFKADNPGVWFMHCHLERHATWGMETVFIVKNGKKPSERMLPPPRKMPPC
ncbi:laccase [Ranunculus cassubicifolius]